MFSTVARKLGKVGHVVTFYLFSRIRKTLDLVKGTHGSKRGGVFLFCVCVCEVEDVRSGSCCSAILGDS